MSIRPNLAPTDLSVDALVLVVAPPPPPLLAVQGEHLPDLECVLGDVDQGGETHRPRDRLVPKYGDEKIATFSRLVKNVSPRLLVDTTP